MSVEEDCVPLLEDEVVLDLQHSPPHKTAEDLGEEPQNQVFIKKKVAPFSTTPSGGPSNEDDRVAAAAVLGKQILTFCLLYLAYVSLYMTRKPFGNTKSSYKALDGYRAANAAGGLPAPAPPTDTGLSIVDTCFQLPYALSGIFLSSPLLNPDGKLHYFRPKTLLAICTALSGLCCLLFPLVPTLEDPDPDQSAAEQGWTFSLRTALWNLPHLLVWALNGAAQGLAWPLIMRLLLPAFARSKQGIACACWATSQGCGGILGPALTKHCMGAEEAGGWLGLSGWRMAFVLPGAGVVLVSWLMLLLPELELKEGEEDHHGGSEAEEEATSPQSLQKSLEEAEGEEEDKESSPKSPPPSEKKILVPGERLHSTTAAAPRKESSESGDATSLKKPTCCSALRMGPPGGVALLCASYFLVKLTRYAYLQWLPLMMAECFPDVSGRTGSSMRGTNLGNTLDQVFQVGAWLGPLFCGLLADCFLSGRKLYAAALLASVFFLPGSCGLAYLLLMDEPSSNSLLTGLLVVAWIFIGLGIHLRHVV